MRINLNIANSFLIYALERAGAIGQLRHDGGDLLLIERPTGEAISIHLVERDIDVVEVTNVLTRNTKADIYTLFLLWCDMLLPENGQRYLPYDWMSALMTAYGDRIYAYDLYEQEVSFFPVYFDKQASGLERLVRHGAGVDFRNMCGETIRADGQHLKGVFRVASFDPSSRRSTASGKTTLSADRNSMQAYYAVLGLERDASLDAIKKAYRQLARVFHPDVNKTPEATERMQQINTAYAMLLQQFGGESV